MVGGKEGVVNKNNRGDYTVEKNLSTRSDVIYVWNPRGETGSTVQ